MKRVDTDLRRFRRIVKGEIRKGLKRFVNQGELLTRQGDKTVSVPLPNIRMPRFTYGSLDGGGVGQGPGEPGEGAGEGEPGEDEGDHELEVEVTLEELAEILGDELELPRIEPKGKQEADADVRRYRSIRRVGPRSLRHFKRTFKQALVRQIASGEYDPDDPNVVPIPEDERYRSFEVLRVPESSAVLMYVMDVSGSMGDEQKEIVRNTAFWLDTWIRAHYRNVEARYIVHDASAREVDRHAFFHLKEAGGTKISSAYHRAIEILDEDYPPALWNTYVFQFSDGDNWSGGDTSTCMRLLEERLLPNVNLFCYGQVKSAYGSGQYKRDIDASFAGREGFVSAEIQDKSGILDCIRAFLGTGR